MQGVINNNNMRSNKFFGFIFCFIFLLISFYPIINGGNIRVWALIISLIFFVLSSFFSVYLTSLKIIWIKIGTFIGLFISPLIIAVIFFLVVTPISLLLKLLNKDILNLRFNGDNTYWRERKNYTVNMEKQF